MSADDADYYYNHLQREINWQQPRIHIYGREIASPRLHAWHGDPDAFYTWSGVRHHPSPWTPLLVELKESLHTVIDASIFNGVLLNYYRNHQDSIGMHSDDEKELGEQPVIASLSLGSTRMLKFKSKSGHADPLNIKLNNGSLLLMRGNTQLNWKHGVAKTKKACGGRINLTFRNIILGSMS